LFVFNNSIPLLKRLMSNYIKYILEIVSCFSMGTLGLWRVRIEKHHFGWNCAFDHSDLECVHRPLAELIFNIPYAFTILPYSYHGVQP